MSKKQPESNRKYTDSELNEGFIGRRMRAFADRSRDPGDGSTWAVVLGALMFTLLIVCFSVADQALFAFIIFVLALVWVVVMAQFGKVNVASVLWGSATKDFDRKPVEVVVFQSTLAVALISLIAVVVDAAGGWAFGWYGLILLATIAMYIVVYIKSWIQLVR